MAEGLPGHQKVEILQLCDEVDNLANQFAKLCAQGLGHTPEAQEIARKLNAKLHELKGKIQQALVNRVVEDFMDVSTPLKQFSDAVNVPEGTPGREQNFNQKANNLQAFSDRASKTSRMVAAGGSGGNKKIAEILLGSAAQIDSLTPQLVSAGRIKMNYPASKAADEHLNNLKQQYADTILRMRTLCDQATDPAEFIKASEEAIQKYTFLCEEAIRNKQPQKMVDNTSNIARLVNRVLLVAKQEADNSEDPEFIAKLNAATNKLEQSLPLMVQHAKQVAANINDPVAASHWREANKNLLNAVRGVRGAIVTPPEVPVLPDLAALNLKQQGIYLFLKAQKFFLPQIFFLFSTFFCIYFQRTNPASSPAPIGESVCRWICPGSSNIASRNRRRSRSRFQTCSIAQSADSSCRPWTSSRGSTMGLTRQRTDSSR